MWADGLVKINPDRAIANVPIHDRIVWRVNLNDAVFDDPYEAIFCQIATPDFGGDRGFGWMFQHPFCHYRQLFPRYLEYGW